MNYNKLAKEIFENNKSVGWWDDMNRCIYQTLQLVNTEISEATEGDRKDLMDDHLPHRKMEEVELADALIRILDLGGRCVWNYKSLEGDLQETADRIKATGWTTGRCHLAIVGEVMNLAGFVGSQLDPYELRNKDTSEQYSRVIDSILAYSLSKGYDVEGALTEKVEYNLKRADHKRENRIKDGGKNY